MLQCYCLLFLWSFCSAQAQSALRINSKLETNASQVQKGCSNRSTSAFEAQRHERRDDLMFYRNLSLAKRSSGDWSKDFPSGFSRYCMKETGGTCGWTSCSSWRGPTDCNNGKCYCQAGTCAINGQCVNSCQSDCPDGWCKDLAGKCGRECEIDTGGSCTYFACHSSRGPTECIDGKCICQANFCSESGTCFGPVLPKQPIGFDVCVKDTGQTCDGGCERIAGRATCVHNKCLCAWGFCAVHGQCVNTCSTSTYGTCSQLSCSADRGPTDCVDGHCQCQEGTCADAAGEHCAHPCEKDTLGTCRLLNCRSWHGPTECKDGKCLCLDGQCSQAGKCVPLPDAPKLPPNPPEFEGSCMKDTTGTCKVLPCANHRGPTACVDGHCICAYGYCAVNGECVDKCEKDTAGTCGVLPCKTSRGPVDCVDGKCVCQEGTCADLSHYGCAHPCEKDTLGTCKYLACSSSHGPTSCVDGKCVCDDGYCAQSGKCVWVQSMIDEGENTLPPNPPEFEGSCMKDTTGTCGVLPCKTSRGPTDCVDGKCVCKYGYCAVNGECVDKCETETTGTCDVLPCNTDRGPVDCVDGKCVCQEGTCADHSKYACAHPCEKDTLGTCKYLSCSSSHGPTSCVDGKCLCDDGYCAQGGKCVWILSMMNSSNPILPPNPPEFKDSCMKDTTGTCGVLPCKTSRGPTDCVDGKCVCKYGYCAVNGECVDKCETETTGTCDTLPCNTDRGPVDCVDGKCVCQEGSCADHSKYACAHPCEKDTLGTCKYLSCDSSHGPTSCVDGKCLCDDGYCAQAGKCIWTLSMLNSSNPTIPPQPPGFDDTCVKDTTGTCAMAPCKTSRGPTDCVNGKCVCKYGYCAVNGECVSKCETETTGTCASMPCKSSRGAVDCVDGKCVCQEGACADHSKHSCAHPCEEDTGGTCNYLACHSFRGPTNCVDGKCLCREGFCSQAGTCVNKRSAIEQTDPDPVNVPDIFSGSCMKDTGGTCRNFPCKESRGPTDCIDGKCMCQFGFCSVNGECVNVCDQDTSGTCKHLKCHTDRGAVDCVDGKCVCQEGACSDRSHYACSAPCSPDTGGSCRVFGCDDWRGPTQCVDGKCLCQDDYCALGQFGSRVCTWKYSGMRTTDAPSKATLQELSNSHSVPAIEALAAAGIRYLARNTALVTAAIAGICAGLLTFLLMAVCVSRARTRGLESARQPLLGS